MATVVKQREESPVQPAQRTNAKDEVKKNVRRHRESPDEQDLIGDPREEDFAENTEQNQKDSHATGEHEVVALLLSVPLHCAVFEAHVVVSGFSLSPRRRISKQPLLHDPPDCRGLTGRLRLARLPGFALVSGSTKRRVSAHCPAISRRRSPSPPPNRRGRPALPDLETSTRPPR